MTGISLEKELTRLVGTPVSIDLCPDKIWDKGWDATVNCFLLAKKIGKQPVQIAETVFEYLSKHEAVMRTEVVNAFVNIEFKPAYLLEQIGFEYFPRLPEEECNTCLVEFSSPNTNKPLHLGHVRNNCIGESTANILSEAGHGVVRVNLVNDRGIHICKSMVAYRRFANGATPESTGKKGDHFVGDLYVMFEKEFRRQLPEGDLSKYREDELFDMTEIGREARETLRKWEDGDEETLKLWSEMNGWVMDGFAETYKRYGIYFDDTFMESDTYKVGKEIVENGLKDGLFRKRDDGAVVYDTDNGQEKVLLRSDGTSVYTTQDIGTTFLKDEEFHHPDVQIWVVGDEQEHHFKTLFEILRKLGFKHEMRHLAYGMVNLPNGKMKSREGTVVDADDLLDRMESLVAGSCGDEEAKIVALDSLKFMMLKSNPRTTITFDPEEAIKYEGDTGAYLLYSYVRAKSILERCQVGEATALPMPIEKRLALKCLGYGDAVRRSASLTAPSCRTTFWTWRNCSPRSIIRAGSRTSQTSESGRRG